MHTKLIPLLFAGSFFVGMLTSCKKDPTSPNGCDTCGKYADTAGHAFTWQQYTIPAFRSISGCWIFDPQNILLVATQRYGNDGNLWRFDGTTITQFPLHYISGLQSETPYVNCAIFGFDSSNVWLSGGVYSETFVLPHETHTTYANIFTTCNYPQAWFDKIGNRMITSSWGSSKNDMFFVADKGYMERISLSAGTEDVIPPSTNVDLKSIWGLSHNDIWACGTTLSTGATTLLHYDGSTWTEDILAQKATQENEHLLSVWCCDSLGHRVLFVTGSKKLFIRTDLGVWREDPTLFQNSSPSFPLMCGNSSTDLMVASDKGVVLHWNGHTWKKYDELYLNDSTFVSHQLSVKGNTVCVAGTKQGKSWVAIGTRK